MPDTLRIEIRDRRLRGGRLSISADTVKAKVRAGREAAVRALLDRGDVATIDRLRARKLHIAEVEAAFRKGRLPELEAESERAGPVAPRPTVGGAVRAMIRTVEATREPATLQTYKSVGDGLIAAFGDGTALDDVTHEQAEGWLHAKKHRGATWSARSQAHNRTFARRIWRSGGATKDPFAKIQLPRVRTTRDAFLQPAEWRTLLASVEGTPLAAVFALGCLAGLREGEVVNLRTDLDVDLNACVIRVQPRQGQHAWKPKTDRSVANVPFTPGGELHRILLDHVRRGFAGERYFIHLPKVDRPVTEKTIIVWTKKAFTRVGLRYGRAGEGLTYHSLRHTFASWMAQRDVQLIKIARLMRDSVEVVAKHYAHLLPEDLVAAVSVVDEMARSPEAPK